MICNPGGLRSVPFAEVALPAENFFDGVVLIQEFELLLIEVETLTVTFDQCLCVESGQKLKYRLLADVFANVRQFLRNFEKNTFDYFSKNAFDLFF